MGLRLLVGACILLLSSRQLGAWKTASGFSMDRPNVTVETHELAGSIYWLQGSVANVYASVGPDGILLIDAEFEPMTNKIRKALSALNLGPVRYLINAHWHSDHTGGNADFAKTGTVVVAQ